MERAGLGTTMLMLTALSVLAPAAKWIAGAESPRPETIRSAETSAKPRRSAVELREVVRAYKEETTNGDATRRSARSDTELRDPFEAAPAAIVILPRAEASVMPSLPAVELLGIVEASDGSIATISIDGNIVSLRLGESSSGVQLRSVTAPEAAELEILGKKVTVRVQ